MKYVRSVATVPTDPFDDVEDGPRPDVAHNLRQRALRGGVTLIMRAVGVRLLGLVATVLLARLLTPNDLGLAALGMTALVVGGLLADGGIGVGLLRRAEQPTQAELGALLGVQLVLAVALSGAVAAVAVLIGRGGLVTAAIVAGLPVYALRAPPTILSERELDYAPIAAAEIAESVAYAVVAVALAYAGLGVWAIVVGSLARAVVGTVTLLVRSRHGLPWPRPRLALVRPLVAFGVRFQSAGLVSVVRDEGLNVLVAALGGVAQLGVWSLGRRCAQVSFVVFESLWRVTYPVYARLLEAGADLRADLERGLRVSGAGTGLALVGVAASAPALVPALVGPGWGQVAPIVATAALGLVVSGPISVTFSGYLYALGEAGQVLRCLVAAAGVWLLAAGVLLPTVGIVGVAAGWTIASWTESVLLVHFVRRSLPGVTVSRLWPPVVAALAVGLPFWLLARSVAGLAAGVAVAASASLTYAVVMTVADRSLLDLARRHWRSALVVR